jgi:hypothetical protein
MLQGIKRKIFSTWGFLEFRMPEIGFLHMAEHNVWEETSAEGFIVPCGRRQDDIFD